MSEEVSITISRKGFISALDRARREGKKEALQALDDRKDAACCPHCGTVATMDHIAEKEGRCPFCFRFYPAGTHTLGGRVFK